MAQRRDPTVPARREEKDMSLRDIDIEFPEYTAHLNEALYRQAVERGDHIMANALVESRVLHGWKLTPYFHLRWSSGAPVEPSTEKYLLDDIRSIRDATTHRTFDS
jgi:hypothetical protein